MTNQPCQTQQIHEVVATFHPNYKTVLADSHLMGEVKRLVDEKGQYLTGFKRQLVIAEAVIEVIYRYSQLEPSIWF